MERFYLKSNEEFFSIIDNIKLSKDINLALVVPSGTAALKSIINLRILKEESIFLGKKVYISTADGLIRKLSMQAGIDILEVQDAGQPQIKRPDKIMGRVVDLRTMADVVNSRKEEEVVENFEPEPKFEFEPQIKTQPENDFFYKERFSDEKVFAEPLPEKIQRIKKTRKFRIPIKKILISLGILIAVLGLAYVVYFVLPHAQIVINPKKESVKFETDIAVNKDISAINVDQATIPGQLFEVEKMESREFPSTGERDVSEKAKGKITIYNQYSSSPQTLVKTTRLKSTDGKIFRLTATVTIPGAIIDEGKIVASSKEVDVEADEAGADFNIGPSDFKIPGFEGTPKYSAFYGKSTQPMTGGAKGKMKVATQDDITGAINIVAVGLKERASQEFRGTIPNDLKLLSDSQSLEVTESSSTVKANMPGEKFTVTVKVRAVGLAFKEQDVLNLLEKNVADKISENRTLLFSTIKIDYKTSKFDSKKGSSNLICSVEADSVWNFDANQIRKDLIGKTETEARTYLSSLAEIETAKIVLWPFWVKQVPDKEGRIKVLIKIN
ncbi:MAG: hypothetical protein V1686_02220 [Patescibacteria group bacterium]